MNLLDLPPPFTEGDRVRWSPEATLPADRAYTVTAITDQGHQWRLDASQGKHSGRHITTRWPKDQPPRVEAA